MFGRSRRRPLTRPGLSITGTGRASCSLRRAPIWCRIRAWSSPPTSVFPIRQTPALDITPGYGAGYEGVPFVSLAGGFAFGNNQAGNFSQTGNVYQALDTYSRILGRHTLKFGVDIRNQRLNQLYFYNVSGGFFF